MTLTSDQKRTWPQVVAIEEQCGDQVIKLTATDGDRMLYGYAHASQVFSPFGQLVLTLATISAREAT